MNFNNGLSTNLLHYKKKNTGTLNAKNNSSKSIGHWNRFLNCIERRNWGGLCSNNCQRLVLKTITMVEITDFRILQHVENRPYKKVQLKRCKW
jgi:hypothetical protein